MSIAPTGATPSPQPQPQPHGSGTTIRAGSLVGMLVPSAEPRHVSAPVELRVRHLLSRHETRSAAEDALQRLSLLGDAENLAIVRTSSGSETYAVVRLDIAVDEAQAGDVYQAAAAKWGATLLVIGSAGSVAAPQEDARLAPALLPDPRPKGPGLSPAR